MNLEEALSDGERISGVVSCKASLQLLIRYRYLISVVDKDKDRERKGTNCSVDVELKYEIEKNDNIKRDKILSNYWIIALLFFLCPTIANKYTLNRTGK